MKVFEESDRYNLPHLTADSIVLDFGAYEGRWGRLIAEKYGCKVHMFEPIKRFFDKLNIEMHRHPLAHLFTVHNMGVGAATTKEKFRVQGDMSGVAADGPEEDVFLIGIADLMNNSLYEGKPFGALKFNIECSEYPVMEAMLDHGLMSRCEHIQTQFHRGAPRATERMDYICNQMLMTHRVLWHDPFVWSGWGIKG